MLLPWEVKLSYRTITTTIVYRLLIRSLNLEYSTKNIPFPNERNYKTKLVEQTEKFIKRLRWKAIFFDTKDEREENEEVPQNFGLKSNKSPSQVRELIPFENDLFQLAKDIKFRRASNDFQKRMKNDVKKIRNSEKTLTPADKTSNMYRLTTEEYKTLRMNAITTKYKKGSEKLKEKIDKGGFKFAKQAGVQSRMEVSATNNAFVTLKDHKDNFENNPTTRLINPAKNEVGRLSKAILDKINENVKQKTSVNQWKSTKDVINWFKNIENKENYTFTMFDVKDFYPSISENLLKEALEFAKRQTKVTKKDIDIVMHARKSLLFNEEQVWIKRNGGLFDVTMGAYDGAEVCELVGTYMLNIIGEKYDKTEIGLYRDDGLAISKNQSGPQNERMKKFLQKAFKDKGLDLVIQCNMKIVNYLDVTLNLSTGQTKPYRKEDDETNYIHTESDHPPNIIRQLPLSIEKRLSTLSSSEAIFDEAKGYYQEALRRSGYNHELQYQPPTQKRRQRKKEVIWFNPPYSRTVQTDIGKKFLRLIDKHFPRTHRYHRIFNRKTVKVSYGCMPNIGSIISSHNKKILNDKKPLERDGCNCRQARSCPLEGQCLTTNVLYEATVTSPEEGYAEKQYVGISEPPFKTRLRNHTRDFNNEAYDKTTELSKEVWKVKNRGFDPVIKWRIVKQLQSYNPETKKCQLCIGEKMEILERDPANLLNKRSELVSTCRHRNKFLLHQYDVG